MCELMTALAVASAGMSYMGQAQAAKAQEAANRQATALALQNQQLQIRALQNQEDEDRAATQNEVLSNSRAADAARATSMVAAGEAGVSGLSVDALLGDLVMQETNNRNNLLTSQDYRQRQRQLDREGVGITTRSQINQLPTVQKPSILGSALQAGIDGVGAYRQSQIYNAARTK